MKATDAIPQRAQDAPPRPGTSVREHATPGSAVSSLLARGLDVRREGARIVGGFALLILVGVTALNVTLWHNAGKRIEEESWRRLEAATDVRRAEVDRVLDVFRREALSVARDPFIAAAVGAARPGGSVADRGPLLDDLFSRAEEFDFRDAIVTESDGVAIAGREPLPDVADANDTRAAREAVSTGQPVWGGPSHGRLVLAVPVACGDGRSRAIVFHAAGYRGGDSGALSARRRHLDALHRARANVVQAADTLTKTRAFELFAEDLRRAQLSLSEITGEVSSDDLLGEIFSSFCIGK